MIVFNATPPGRAQTSTFSFATEIRNTLFTMPSTGKATRPIVAHAQASYAVSLTMSVCSQVTRSGQV